MNGLAASRPGGDDLLGRGGPAVADQIPGLLGGLGLDHHDRDVTVRPGPGRRRPCRRWRSLELVDVGEADPLVTDQGDADAADRAGERQTGELGGQRGGVDGHHVVESCWGSAPSR